MRPTCMEPAKTTGPSGPCHRVPRGSLPPLYSEERWFDVGLIGAFFLVMGRPERPEVGDVHLPSP